MKTLPVYIFRCSLGDCTNGGISATGDTLYLACPDGYVDTPEDDPRLIRLVKRDLPWMDTPYVHAEPANDPPPPRWRPRRPHGRRQLRVCQRLTLPCNVPHPPA